GATMGPCLIVSKNNQACALFLFIFHSVELILEPKLFVLYLDVPTGGPGVGLPPVTDVVVPVPDGYPASTIDLAGLPLGAAFLPRDEGGQNNQGVVTADGRG